jgi:hypothetical protein
LPSYPSIRKPRIPVIVPLRTEASQLRPNRNHPRRLRNRVASLLFLFALLLPTTLALARAGGGEGFSDGGGGGGGGGHGAGGLIYLIYMLIRLIIFYPVIGIPVLILIILFVFYANKQGTTAYQSSVLRRGGAVIENERKSSIIEQLRQHDPTFDESAFCNRVQTAFTKIQSAWCAQKLSDVQLFLSDGVAERFALQFAEQRDQGYRDQMDGLGIDDVRIADLNCTGLFDEISVRIAAHAADYRVSLATGKWVRGYPTSQPFVEVWSFLRRRGALTDLTKPGLIEGNCPNCGAAVTMNQTTQCPYCHALLKSGQYDWVLAEITQESQWERASDQAVPNLPDLLQSDDGFAVQALEDRASVIFWRKASADRIGKIDPLRKVAMDPLCEKYTPMLKPPRRFIADCAVGGVHMISFLPAGASDPMDRILVQIRWSGTLTSVDASGQATRQNPLVQTSLLVLARKPGSRTDADKSITSAHCPNCGAPESQSIENKCAACGTVLNDGSRNWVLADWLSLADPAAQALLSAHRATAGSTPAPSHMTGLLAWAVKMSIADGQIDPRQRTLLEQFAAHSSVPPDELNHLIQAAIRGDLTIPEPATPEEARDWLTAITRMALTDGTLDKREMQLLNLLGSKANLGAYDVELLLKRVHAEQYAAARSNVRF